MSFMSDTDKAKRGTRTRYVVLVLIALAPLWAYQTRIISAFNTTMAGEFRVSDAVMGDVIAGFALGYFFFQIPGGLLASALGVRRVLPVLCLAWSLCAVWGSFAHSAEELYWSRVALGVAQAGLVPCCAQVAANWFPLSRRGLVSAMLTGGMQLGAMAATGLSAMLLVPLGWRHILQFYAVPGIAWSAIFYLWFRDRPEDHKATNRAEQALIHEGRAALAPSARITRPDTSWLKIGLAMTLSVSVLAYYTQAFFRAYGYEFFTTWCPAYLEKAYGLTREAAGELATWPVTAFAIGSLLGGLVVDYLLARTASRWVSRCAAAAAGLGICAACFAVATQVTDAHLVIVVLSIGCLFFALSGPAT